MELQRCGFRCQYLAKNQTKVEQFTITLDDGNGGTVDRTIEVTITGTNDAPVLTVEPIPDHDAERRYRERRPVPLLRRRHQHFRCR